ncbi:MAG: Ig-like domain-containing protein, partial [Elusimicrobiota bacterium]
MKLFISQLLLAAFIVPGQASAANTPPVAADDAYTMTQAQTLTRGSSGGMFSRTQAVQGFVVGFDIGDVDNDGEKELVVAKTPEMAVEVYDSAYRLKYSFPFPGGPRSVLIEDLDGDGQNELAVGGSGGSPTGPCGDPYDGCYFGQGADTNGPLYIYKVSPDGTHTVAWTVSNMSFRFANQLAAFDINTNGKQDLVVGEPWWNRRMIAFEHNGATYGQSFYDGINSDVNAIAPAGSDFLAAGTSCWGEYGFRIYNHSGNVVFSDTGDGISGVAAGDLDGDGQLEFVRGLNPGSCGSGWSSPVLWIYDHNYQKVFTSPALSTYADSQPSLDVGELLTGGGEELALGTLGWGYQAGRRESVSVFQFDGSGYAEVWRDDMEQDEADVFRVHMADLDGDGRNELYAGTSHGVFVYRPGPSPEGVLANDSDPDGDLISAELVSGPSDGALSLNSNGSFTYTPDPMFSGTDGFTYRASDGLSYSAEAAVTITVEAIPNDPPTAADDSYVMTQGETLVAGATDSLLSKAQAVQGFVVGFDIGDVDNDGEAELVVAKTPEMKVEVYDSAYNLESSWAFPGGP